MLRKTPPQLLDHAEFFPVFRQFSPSIENAVPIFLKEVKGNILTLSFALLPTEREQSTEGKKDLKTSYIS